MLCQTEAHRSMHEIALPSTPGGTTGELLRRTFSNVSPTGERASPRYASFALGTPQRMPL